MRNWTWRKIGSVTADIVQEILEDHPELPKDAYDCELYAVRYPLCLYEDRFVWLWSEDHSNGFLLLLDSMIDLSTYFPRPSYVTEFCGHYGFTARNQSVVAYSELL